MNADRTEFKGSKKWKDAKLEQPCRENSLRIRALGSGMDPGDAVPAGRAAGEVCARARGGGRVRRKRTDSEKAQELRQKSFSYHCPQEKK